MPVYGPFCRAPGTPYTTSTHDALLDAGDTTLEDRQVHLPDPLPCLTPTRRKVKASWKVWPPPREARFLWRGREWATSRVAMVRCDSAGFNPGDTGNESSPERNLAWMLPVATPATERFVAPLLRHTGVQAVVVEGARVLLSDASRVTAPTPCAHVDAEFIPLVEGAALLTSAHPLQPVGCWDADGDLYAVVMPRRVADSGSVIVVGLLEDGAYTRRVEVGA